MPTRPIVLFVFGTRPEAIKLCPLITYMRAQDTVDVRVCVTSQHRDMLNQVLAVFGIVPDSDLQVMRPGQTLFESTATILVRLAPLITPGTAIVIVQGDTTSTLCGALAAFYAGVPVGHVEAGLRTGDMRRPFPEEMNRVLVTRLSTLHFAATDQSADNLRREGVPPDSIHVTGNTGVDALLQVAGKLERGEVKPEYDWRELDRNRKAVVVTVHRRESFGAPLARICDALLALAARSDLQIIYPVHPNPNVSDAVRQRLGAHPNILLTDPLDYVSFVELMRRAWLLLTDSGGIQEEAPSLGKPVIVMRDNTERPEAVQAGTAQLVGSDVDAIVGAVERLAADPTEYMRRAQIRNPYGDGHARQRIAAAVMRFCQR